MEMQHTVKIIIPSDLAVAKRRRRRRSMSTSTHHNTGSKQAALGSIPDSSVYAKPVKGVRAVKQVLAGHLNALTFPQLGTVGVGVTLGLFGCAKLVSGFANKRKKSAQSSYDDEMARFNDLLGGDVSAKFQANSLDGVKEASGISRSAPTPPPPSPSPRPKKQGIGLFKRKPSRPLDIDDFLGVDGPMKSFNEQLVSHLANSVAFDRFDLYILDEEFDLDATAEPLTKESVAESIAQCVNAMLIPLVDNALAILKRSSARGESAGDEETVAALEQLEEFMSHAGALFERLAAGVTIKPVKYSGTASKKQLEGLFTKSVLKFDAASIDNLQRVLGIKDGAAERLSSAVMMEQMTDAIKMASEEEGGMEALQELLGGGDPEELAAAVDPAAGAENFQEMIDVLKVALAGSEEDRTAARKELDETFGAMGMDLKTMASIMKKQKDPQSKELTMLFEQLLDPSYKPSGRPPVVEDDDLLGI